MIKVILLDLDDTLLHTDTRQFANLYLKAVATRFAIAHPDKAERMGPALKTASRAMMTSLDPTRTNGQIFNEMIAQNLGIPLAEWEQSVTDFHADDYLPLIRDVKAVTGANDLIDELFGMGLAVVIATNPVFPLDAIRRRMWQAGLEQAPFSLITSGDEMHFTKPNPHYYEEILARVGVEADEAIMVGDSLENDMVGAAKAGLNTFWIESDQGSTATHIEASGLNGIPADFDQSMIDGYGSLADFAEKVKAGWLGTLNSRPRTVEQVIPRMLGDTAALFTLIKTVRPEYWNMRPDPNEWSPLEIVCHLRDSERNVQRPRLQKIAAEHDPFVSQPTTPPGPGERDLAGEDGYQAAREFWDERCTTITFLDQLSLADWQRPARHSIFGPTTLLEMAHFTTRHDHLHINQLCQTVGRCKQQ